MPNSVKETRTSGGRVTVALPLFELIDKDGKATGHRSANAQYLAGIAKGLWPDQEQDEDRTGKGWDVQVVGVK
jgi:hypothetical protein